MRKLRPPTTWRQLLAPDYLGQLNNLCVAEREGGKDVGISHTFPYQTLILEQTLMVKKSSPSSAVVDHRGSRLTCRAAATPSSYFSFSSCFGWGGRLKNHKLVTLNPLPRLLHHPKLYKKIHKKHHEWTAPIGVIALYCHPVEHVVGRGKGQISPNQFA